MQTNDIVFKDMTLINRPSIMNHKALYLYQSSALVGPDQTDFLVLGPLGPDHLDQQEANDNDGKDDDRKDR
jgi:hypothetical protein